MAPPGPPLESPMEGQQLGVTSFHSGFYVNKGVSWVWCQQLHRSSSDQFDPNPAKLAHHSHHLIGVFNQVCLSVCVITMLPIYPSLQISPLFKKNFAMLQKQM